jgi:hypothetical protein
MIHGCEASRKARLVFFPRGRFQSSPAQKLPRHIQSTFHEKWIEHTPTPIKQACPTFHEKWIGKLENKLKG